MQPIFWLAALILFGVGEAVTVGLTSIWFALGSLGALIVSSLGFGFWPQFITFVVLSAISMALLRPIARKLLKPNYSATNADRVLDHADVGGQHGQHKDNHNDGDNKGNNTV